MESGSLSNMPALRNLCSPFSFWRSCSNRIPKYHAKNSRSPSWDYEKCKTEMMKKPQIRHIFDIMELDMLLLNLINLTTGKLKTESNQNQLKQLVELIKMNVKLLIHEPDLLQSISKLNWEELDGLLAESHTTDQASTQHDDPLKWIKEIYDQLERAKAKAGQFEFDQNWIEAIRKSIFQAERQLKRIKVRYDQLENAKAKTRQVELDNIKNLIQQCHEEFQPEDQLAPSGSRIDPYRLNNDVAEHIVNLLPVELRPASAKSNLKLVKWNLEEIHKILNHNLILLTEEPHESNSNQKSLTDKLIKVTSNLTSQISIVDNLSNPQDDSNWEEFMESHVGGIIPQMCIPIVELYIDRMDSFKDICSQVAAMYKQSYHQIIKSDERRIDANYTWCGSFHEDILKGNCKAVEKFLKENPLALTANITVDGNTAFHVAVQTMQLKMVKMLLKKLREENRLIETLERRNREGKTAIYYAASSGYQIIAEELVKDNEEILLIECDDGTNPLLPLFAAAMYNHKEMVRYIYNKMQNYMKKRTADNQKVDCFSIYEENQNDLAKVWVRRWALFLGDLIHNDDYDMALRVFQDYPNLALIKYTDVDTPLLALAKSRYLGANVTVHSKASILQYFNTFSCSNKIVDDGTITKKASGLLRKFIVTIDDLKSQKPVVSVAFFKAAEVGNYEFVAMFIKSLPLMVYWLNDDHQNIFHVAIINRQENIFNLIYGLGCSIKNDLMRSADKCNNWMLHLAGEIAPPHRLNQVHGPAIQLQRELQWFQAVEKIVPNSTMDNKNLANKTPYELFASTHKDLMKDGKDWMRYTASSCSIVATLNATVVFAAAFTVPGGNNQNTGDPMFLGDLPFLLFVVSDLIALSTSCASVLIFLSILTSGFAQEADFLRSLPTRLIWGLVFLFVSMAAMVFAFCETIYIITRDQYEYWFYIPLILIGFIPVFTFWLMMFPLLINLWRTTNIIATDISIFGKSPGHMY